MVKRGGGVTIFDIASVVDVPVEMSIIVVVVLIGRVVCRHFVAFATTGMPPARGRVDTG